MSVELISTGNEIMSGLTQDRNFSWAAAKLASSGVEVKYHCSVADDLEDLLDCFATAAKRAKFIVISGGLGPTEDDLSALAASKFLGTSLVFNEKVYADIVRKLESRGRKPNSRHEKQALFPEKTTTIENDIGTSAGFSFHFQSSKFYFLPGVPREFKRMFSEYVFPDIEAAAKKGKVLRVKVLKTFGLGESEVAQKLGDFSPQGVGVGYRIRSPEIHIRLTASDENHARVDSFLNRACEEAQEKLGRHIFSQDEKTLEEVTASLLLEKDLTLSVAESCTGGLCASRLTDIAGSSGYFLGGAVTYCNDSKEKLLGVRAETLLEFGAVSAETVSEMASGVKSLFGSDIGLSISGVAGPGGGTEDKPVGTVWFGFTHASLGTFCEKRNFVGTRNEIKDFAAATAIDMVRNFCLDYVK